MTHPATKRCMYYTSVWRHGHHVPPPNHRPHKFSILSRCSIAPHWSGHAAPVRHTLCIALPRTGYRSSRATQPHAHHDWQPHRESIGTHLLLCLLCWRILALESVPVVVLFDFNRNGSANVCVCVFVMYSQVARGCRRVVKTFSTFHLSMFGGLVDDRRQIEKWKAVFALTWRCRCRRHLFWRVSVLSNPMFIVDWLVACVTALLHELVVDVPHTSIMRHLIMTYFFI